MLQDFPVHQQGAPLPKSQASESIVEQLIGQPIEVGPVAP
jgi:hypothetical protein